MEHAASSVPPVRRAALAFIFVTIVLDMLALGVVVPVLPKLVLSLEGGDSAHAAAIYGLFGTVFAAMQFVFAPVLGALSDRFGRRPVILLSNLGLGLDYLVMALAPSVGWLLVGRTISGICSASFSIPGAYIADVTPPDRRAASFGVFHAAFGFGFVVGPAFGGVLGTIDPRLPFWTAAGLSLANWLYGLFVLPQSLSPGRRAPFQWRRANPIGAVAFLRARRSLLAIAAVAFLTDLAHEVNPTVFVLYTDFRYGWDARTVGLALAAMGISSALVGTLLVGPAVTRLGERTSVLLGLAFGVAAFLIGGLAPTGTLFCAGIPLLALWSLWRPAAQAMMTRRVEPSEQGRLQGALSSLQGVAYMIGPGVFTLSFAAAVAGGKGWDAPGTPFLLAALMIAAALALAWRVVER
jgi:DHA1 family tetracycline resistance protein-like MFS transporter